MARQMASTPDEHLQWGNYHWGKFDSRLREFDGALSKGVVDSHALLRAYRHAYGAEINYLDAKGAHEEPMDVETTHDAYEQARAWRMCMTKMIGMMLEDCPHDVIIHHFKHCMAEMEEE